MADTSAMVEPEIPEKKYSARTTDIPSPPRTQPTRPRARLTSAYDIPQRSMRLPANTNVGTARSTQLCDPATRAEGSFWSEKVPRASPTTPESPRAKTMGVERATRSTNVTTTAATIASERSRTSSARPGEHHNRGCAAPGERHDRGSAPAR